MTSLRRRKPALGRPLDQLRMNRALRPPLLKRDSDVGKSNQVATFAQVANRNSNNTNISGDGGEPPTRKVLQKASLKTNNNERRVMVRLEPDNPTRKLEPFALCDQIRSRVSDPSTVKDIWVVPSGLAILSPTPTKAVSLIQDNEEIRVGTGASAVEQQEEWTTFIVRPILKRQNGFECPVDVTPNRVREELSEAIGKDTMKLVTWTKNSADPHLIEGYARVCVGSSQANRFPMPLCLFGRPVNVSKIKNKPSTPQCTRYFGLHHERNCAKPIRCKDCGAL